MFKTTLLLVSVLTASAAQSAVFPKHLPNFMAKSADPTQNVVYYGGPVIANAQVYFIMWGDKVSPTTTAAMPGFYSSIVNSTYMDFLKTYNTTNIMAQDGTHSGTNQKIGHGTFLQTIQITPAQTTGTIDDLDIQAELVKQMDAGKLPAANANSLYMIHFPKGLKITMHDGATVSASCQQFCAYHNGFQPKTGAAIYYGVIPDLDSLACAFGCGAGDSLARITTATSHELIEAITDPIPTPGTNPAYPQAWNTTDGQEIGDLCQSNTGTLTGKSSTYTIQQEWDNSLGGCTTGDYKSN